MSHQLVRAATSFFEIAKVTTTHSTHSIEYILPHTTTVTIDGSTITSILPYT
jgi:hypothetical protein